jgi:lysophospholipase L1-like esterase
VLAARAAALIALAATAATAQTLNLVALGDSLTEGVPHLGGESETWPYMVSQNFPGATYVKLGYRGQTTGFLMTKIDAFLFGLYKDGYSNVLVLWAGTNDCAVGTLPCVDTVYSNLVSIARTARAAGWKVVAVTMINRSNYFADATHQAQFPANQATVNALISGSKEFDAIADPVAATADPSLYWDGCHLLPPGYQAAAGLITAAIQQALQAVR